MTVFSGCGILGALFFNSERVPEQFCIRFRNMLKILEHRGPNGEGIYENANIILGHRRLSILDTSSKASQPMERDHLTIVVNGEIYNYKEIRNTLISSGFSFYSESDSEVALRAYQHWGTDCINHFNGMFAMAIWNSQTKKVFIARDRMGEKPFYYFLNNNVFLFSSEIEPLLASGIIPNEINWESFEHQLFATSFFPINETDSLIKQIKSLPSGSFVEFASESEFIIKTYWDLPDINKKDNINPQEALQDFEQLFSDSVSLRMISDVPICAFLSGGLDSSLINYFAAQETSHKINSLTVNYSEGGINSYTGEADLDLIYSRELANCLNSKINHTVVEIETHNTSIKDIDKVIDIASLADDDRMLSINKNYNAVNVSNFTVALNGQAADEMMCGYISLPPFYNLVFDAAKPNDDIFYKMYPARTIPGKHLLAGNASAISKNVYSNVFDSYNEIKAPADEKVHRFLTMTQLRRVLQMEDYLSMQNSIECRLPFLDHRLVELIFKMPFSHHYDSETRTGKNILRQIASKYLPESIANRHKQAFPSAISHNKILNYTNIINNNISNILDCETIRKYFDYINLQKNVKDMNINELWLIIAIWRWEKKVKQIKILS